MKVSFLFFVLHLSYLSDRSNISTCFHSRSFISYVHIIVKVKEECRTILSESLNDRWSIDATNTYANPGIDGLVESYSRPVYTYVGGLPEDAEPKESDEMALIYSGSRW